jgi:hypothetical protein
MLSRGVLLTARLSIVAVSALLIDVRASAQSPTPLPADDVDARAMTAVRAALGPILTFPPSDEDGALPADGTSTAQWMIRPSAPGDRIIEVIANPLNLANQQRSIKAMLQIGVAIEAAQRKSQAQYERALADAQRTGKSQNVDGITLADEGVAGARIDAELHLTIEVVANDRVTEAISSSVEPVLSTAVPGSVAVVSVPANVYRDRESAGEERFCAAETWLFFGAYSAPSIRRRSGTAFDVVAALAPTADVGPSRVSALAVRLQGNEGLIAQVIRGADWTRVESLVRQR